uniref:Uncharacterized protein n=1 Tax=Rhizophora mucronata TaxID=61149 RepID=A0A2P2N2G1_RHIMU
MSRKSFNVSLPLHLI